jgi:hypothetical protein
MSKRWIVGLGFLGIIILGALMMIGVVVGTLNSEADLRVQIEAKQLDNKNEYDAMWKKISQVAEVTQAQKDALLEIFKGYAEARTGTGNNGAVMKWIQEAIPNVDTSTFNNLQNIIVTSRDRWTARQKELIDYSREHNRFFERIPSCWVMSIFGRKKVEIKIVTSSRTNTSFETGVDDDVSVLPKKTAPQAEKK